MASTQSFIALTGVVIAGAYLAIKRVRWLRRAAIVGVGDKPEFRFRSPLLGRPGVDSLADLRGVPTLVLTWGTG